MGLARVVRFGKTVIFLRLLAMAPCIALPVTPPAPAVPPPAQVLPVLSAPATAQVPGLAAPQSPEVPPPARPVLTMSSPLFWLSRKSMN